MKNLVLAFSTNQAPNDLYVFCRSLRDIYDRDTCDVVVMTNKHEPYFEPLMADGVTFVPTVSAFRPNTGVPMKILRRVVLQGARAVHQSPFSARLPAEIGDAYRTMIEAWHHPHFARWFAYRRYLELNRNYGHVFIADGRDVVFQTPFFPEADDRVRLFTEDEPFGSPGFNTDWYKNAWGAQALERARGELPVCMGTIMGPYDLMTALVDEIIAFFCRYPFRAPDQGVFNRMVVDRLLKTPVEKMTNITGPVATLSSENSKAETSVDGGVIRRKADGSIIPIVHMYDRFPDTSALYDRYLPPN